MGTSSSRQGGNNRSSRRSTRQFSSTLRGPASNLPVTLNNIYPNQTCKWNPKSYRSLIVSKKLAPLYKGVTDPSELKDKSDVEECPICFLFYPGGLNWCRCCKNRLCSECFLVSTPPGETNQCPFCNRTNFGISFTGPKSAEEKQKEEEEEERFKQATLRMRQEEIERDKLREQEKREKRDAAENSADSNLSTISEVSTPTGNKDSVDPMLNLDYDAIRSSEDPELALALQLSMMET